MGGIFFDDLPPTEETLAFVAGVAGAFLPAYVPIVERRKDDPGTTASGTSSSSAAAATPSSTSSTTGGRSSASRPADGSSRS